MDLDSIGFKNIRNFRKFKLSVGPVSSLVQGVERDYENSRNEIVADPYDFERASARVDQESGKFL